MRNIKASSVDHCRGGGRRSSGRLNENPSGEGTGSLPEEEEEEKAKVVNVRNGNRGKKFAIFRE